MTVRRGVLLVTCVVVAALAVWFALDQRKVSTIATAVSALVAVAALGVGVWTTLRSSTPGPVGTAPTIRVRNTGSAKSGRKGLSVSGAVGGKSAPAASVTVDGSGDAESGDGGTSVSGSLQQ